MLEWLLLIFLLFAVAFTIAYIVLGIVYILYAVLQMSLSVCSRIHQQRKLREKER